MRNPSSTTSLSSSSPSSRPQAAANSGSAVGSSGTSNKTTPCCTKVGLKRGPWTPEEDKLLAAYVKREGEGRWRALPKKAGLLRCGKSCRLRWMNYLRPSVKRGHIAPDEEDLILRLHRLLGNRWSLIAGRIPGRTDNEIKNYWNTHLSKKLISQGLDPRTHKPLESNCKSSINDKKANPILPDPRSSTYYEPSPPVLIDDAGNGCTSIPVGGTIFKPDDQYYQNAETTVGKDVVNMQNADHGDIGRMDLRSNHEGLSNEDINENINYCTDDIFSSFLNSLINEDSFNCQNLVATNCDAFVDSTPAFTFGPGWDASAVADTSSFDENDSKRLKEQVEKQF